MGYLIFKYNSKGKYSTKDLKSNYAGDGFLALDLHLNEKGASVKIQLLNIFKDYHIVEWKSPTAIGYDRWSLSNALWEKFYKGHGKYKPELSEYFHMY